MAPPPQPNPNKGGEKASAHPRARRVTCAPGGATPALETRTFRPKHTRVCEACEHFAKAPDIVACAVGRKGGPGGVAAKRARRLHESCREGGKKTLQKQAGLALRNWPKAIETDWEESREATACQAAPGDESALDWEHVSWAVLCSPGPAGSTRSATPPRAPVSGAAEKLDQDAPAASLGWCP